MGSVKDPEVLEKPTIAKMGVGRFHYSDRYSVFDNGEMPDHIPNKGAALCMMAAYFFESLDLPGEMVKTHYRGLVDRNGDTIKLDQAKEPIDTMEVDLVRVVRPTFSEGSYDYSVFGSERGNFLIPLEVIYRNSLPAGSSVFRRLENGSITPEDLNLDKAPEAGQKLENPFYDVSTKLEEKDRYIRWSEAQQIAALTDEEIRDIRFYLGFVNEIITDRARQVGLENEDGKIELAFDPERELMVLDAIGTLDECRFTYNGIPLSKEVVRQFYRETKWYEDLKRAKGEAQMKGVKDWKSLCRSKPIPLDPELLEIFSDMYTATANALIGREIFDAPRLEEVVKRYTDWLRRSVVF